MTDSKNQIPILTGPGAFFIALIIIALGITSSTSRDTLIENPLFIAGLVTLSIPFSVFFVQIFYGLYTISLIFFPKDYGSDFTGYATYELDCFIDYLSHKPAMSLIIPESKSDYQNEWDIIYRKAQGRNLFGTLCLECVTFLLFYSFFIFANWANEDLNHYEICIFLVIVTLLALIFLIVMQKLSRVIEMYDRKIIRNFNSELLSWANDELIKQGEEN